MNATYEDVLKSIEDLRTTLIDSLNSGKLSPNQIFIVNGLSDISQKFGLITSGEFRTGNTKDPGKGFTGVRMAFPGMDYGSQSWHLVGINNDVLQFGLNAVNGEAWAGGGNIRLTSGGILVYNNSVNTGAIQSDGDVFFGSNIGAAGTTSLAIFSNDQTYNGESVGAGDILIGDNSSGKPNLFWDSSLSQLQFRSGTLIMSKMENSKSLSQIGVNIWRNTTQSIPTGAGMTRVSFTSVDFDDYSFFSLSQPTRITIPTGMNGVYLCGFQILWNYGGGSTSFAAGIIKNWTSSVSDINGVETASDVCAMSTSNVINLIAGDYIELAVRHSSGSAIDLLNVNSSLRPNFWAIKIR